jgi:hypothetical protein
MSSFNLYDTTVVYFINGLNTLTHILKKAEEHGKAQGSPEADFMNARLIEDMNPLTFQIQTASNTAKNTLMRILGTEPIPMDDNESTFAELHERIQRTLDILKQVKRQDFDMDVDQEIKVAFGSRGDRTWTKRGYVQGFAIPNFYFHVVTAYAILRKEGVKVGKIDFIAPGEA